MTRVEDLRRAKDASPAEERPTEDRLGGLAWACIFAAAVVAAALVATF
jgi:hypothetical protein